MTNMPTIGRTDFMMGKILLESHDPRCVLAYGLRLVFANYT